MTNKTPIQELIEYFYDMQNNARTSNEISIYINEVCATLETYQQKEKAFAFDCFEEGQDTIILLGRQELEDAFEDFYSQYAEQHNK